MRPSRPTDGPAGLSELDQLHRAYDAKHSSTGRRAGPSRVETLMSSAPTAVHKRHPDIMRSAAASHHINDAYVADLRDAYGIPDEPAPTKAHSAPIARLLPSTARTMAPALPTKLNAQWLKGPIDPAGTLVDLSDRPIMCIDSSVAAQQVLLGCSDHASYALDCVRQQKQKTLYGKRVGHSEWVTSVCYLRDGSNKMVSAGMDGKIMIWDAVTGKTSITAEPRATVLEAHFGSISSVRCPKSDSPDGVCAFGHLIVSCGYDKTVILWDGRTGSCLAEHKEHAAPAVIQSIQPQTSATDKLMSCTGDRDGVIKVWDFGAASNVGTLTGHKGHITALTWLSSADPAGRVAFPWHDNMIASGAQDGHVRLWDIRARRCAMNIELHVTDEGAGAVGDIASAVIETSPGRFEVVLVSAGADGAICVLDPAAGFTCRHRITTHKDFIYSMVVHESLCLSGDGRGVLIAHDLASGKPLWGLGANAAAVRCIAVVGNTLVASGDDGKALFYSFS